MSMRSLTIVAITGSFFAATLAAPAHAGWKRIEVEPTEIGKGAMAATPESEWNRWSRRESTRGETWTKDGFQLNRLDFAGQIAVGDPLYKDRKKKERPLPKFQAGMIATDLADLFGSTFRIYHDVTQFEQTGVDAAKLGVVDAIEVRFEYSLPNDVLTRKGIARLAVHDGELYMVSFVAPELHYFDASIAEVTAIMNGISLL